MQENTMTIAIQVPQNADNASIAAALRMRAGLFEGLTAKAAASRKNTDAPAQAAARETEDTDTDTTDDDEDFATETKTTKGKKGGKQAAASFDEDEDTGADTETETTDEDEDFTAPPKKTTKAAKITVAQVNDACKAYAKENGRPAVLKILKKQFKTESISEIKPEQYAAVIKAMAV